MDGNESDSDPVSAVGEAAEIVEWIECFCPDMVPMAPLLKELAFSGFSETRYSLLLLVRIFSKCTTNFFSKYCFYKHSKATFYFEVILYS